MKFRSHRERELLSLAASKSLCDRPLPDDGKVLKAVSVVKDSRETEEIILEELNVFQVRQTSL